MFRLLTDDDVAGMSSDTLYKAYNEIFEGLATLLKLINGRNVLNDFMKNYIESEKLETVAGYDSITAFERTISLVPGAHNNFYVYQDPADIENAVYQEKHYGKMRAFSDNYAQFITENYNKKNSLKSSKHLLKSNNDKSYVLLKFL